MSKSEKVGKVVGSLILALLVSGFVEIFYFIYLWWNKMTNSGRTEFFYSSMTIIGHVIAFGLGALVFMKGVSPDDKFNSSKGK